MRYMCYIAIPELAAGIPLAPNVILLLAESAAVFVLPSMPNQRDDGKVCLECISAIRQAPSAGRHRLRRYARCIRSDDRVDAIVTTRS